MKIVAADPRAAVLSEDQLLALFTQPVVMHLGIVDGKGWPVVNPVWFVYEHGVFRLVIGRTSHKAKVLRANPRAYFCVDTAGEDTRGVRGRARVLMLEGDRELAVDVARKALLKYTGTDTDEYAQEMLGWARDGQMTVVELATAEFRAFQY
jgi:nitroimidazol reductase NimA-like FMN-containing flavoprotein (pyridoxamine 5'-phosphate oxidase superfamily)